MSTAALEAVLARLYTDEAFLTEFLAAPAEVAQRAGLDNEAVAALSGLDRDSLVMAARSFRAKRAQSAPPRASGLLSRWRRRQR